MHGGGQRRRIVGRVAVAIDVNGGDDVCVLQVRQTEGAGDCLVVLNNHFDGDVDRTGALINHTGFACRDCGEQVDIDFGDAGLGDTDGHQVDAEVGGRACGLVHIVFACIAVSHLGNHDAGVTADIETKAAIGFKFARADKGDAITPVQVNHQTIAGNDGAGNHCDRNNVAGSCCG